MARGRSKSETVSLARDLAKACGVVASTVTRWRKCDDLPGGKKGPWDPAAVLEWAKAKRRASKKLPSRKKGAVASDDGQPERQKFLPFEVKAAQAALEKLEKAEKISPELLSCAMAAIRGVTAKDRLEAAKASQAELTLAKMRDELVERSRVHPILVSRCAQLQKQILAVPANVVPYIEGLPQREAMVKIEDALRDALRSFVSKQGLEGLHDDDDGKAA